MEKAEKKALQKQKDAEYKAREIRFGIRIKLILVFFVLIFSIALGLTIVATNQQTSSLLEEKEKQGLIIVRALSSSIKARLIDVFASHADTLAGLKSTDDYAAFYEEQGIADLIFEDVDQVTTQPDVVYAYILGKHNIVLGHTDTKVEPYKPIQFIQGVGSYFEAPHLVDNKLRPIIKKIQFGEKKEDTIDFSYVLAFKENAPIEEAVAEVHIGISLASVNHQIFMTKVKLQSVGFIAIIAGVLIGLLFAAVIAGPIIKVTEGMRKVSEGDFHADVTVKSSDEVGLLSRTFNIMIKGMSILVSPEVAQVVLAGGDLLKGGQKREVTVLFSDIRGFTTISESLTPHEVVFMLNGYLELMTEVILEFGGVVDKFVGDEIFAVFGAPFDHPNHPLAACATALGMGEDLARHNSERRAEGKPAINIGIGLNTGDVISGAMGSTKRVDYTSIGDAVNLGARLEGTNKVYGTLTIISEFTYEKVRGDVVVRELDLIRVKGKNEPVMIYELIALTENGTNKVNQFRRTKPVASEGLRAKA